MSLIITRKVSVTGGTVLRAANNLGDVGSFASARANLGVYSQAEVAAQRNALAPAQALSGNGTAGSTLTLTSTPSGDQTWAFDIDVPAAAPSRAGGVMALGGYYGSAGVFVAYITSGTGRLQVEQSGATSGDVRYAYVDSLVATYGGTRVRCIIKIASAAMTVNINGTAATLVTGTAGTAPAWGDTLGSGFVALGKMQASDYYFTGTLRLLGIENRALSAAEVLAVYLTGTFPTRDRPTQPAGSALIPASAATFTTSSGWNLAPLPGATINTGAGTLTTVAGAGARYDSTDIVAGYNYRATVVVTANTGQLQIYNGSAWVNIGESAATGTIALDYAQAALYPPFIKSSTGAATITDFNAVPLGLLVAPDPAQPGNGLVWGDRSGNGAHILLPTSGVDWLLPSAAVNKLRGTTSTSGNQQLLGGTTLNANTQITRVRARSRSGTPSITLGTASGGSQIVASVALSTTWKDLTIALTGGIISTASSVWVGSSTADVVEIDLTHEPLGY